MIKRFRLWFARNWFAGALVALGLIVGGVALAQTKTFSWTNPTQNTDGSTFDAATEQAESRIYCGIDPAAFNSESPGSPQAETPTVVTPGAAQNAVKDFPPGDYSCFATVLSVFGYESDASKVTTFTVTRL